MLESTCQRELCPPKRSGKVGLAFSRLSATSRSLAILKSSVPCARSCTIVQGCTYVASQCMRLRGGNHAEHRVVEDPLGACVRPTRVVLGSQPHASAFASAFHRASSPTLDCPPSLARTLVEHSSCVVAPVGTCARCACVREGTMLALATTVSAVAATASRTMVRSTSSCSHSEWYEPPSLPQERPRSLSCGARRVNLWLVQFISTRLWQGTKLPMNVQSACLRRELDGVLPRLHRPGRSSASPSSTHLAASERRYVTIMLLRQVWAGREEQPLVLVGDDVRPLVATHLRVGVATHQAHAL